MKLEKNPSRRNTWNLLIAAVVLGSATFAYFNWQTGTTTPASAATPAYQTSAVRTGDISISVSGTGSLNAGSTVDLGFATQGTIAVLNVALGDTVKAGQVLAVLDETDALTVDVTTKKLALQAAQEQLANLTQQQGVKLAQALLDRAAALQAYEEAQDSLLKNGQGRCDAAKTQELYFQYLYAKMNVDKWQGYLDDGNTGYGTNFLISELRPMKSDLNLAYMNYLYCLSYTDQEIIHSEANLVVAEARYKLADAAYQELVASSGIDPVDLAIAEASVTNAAYQYDQALKALAGATITAPIDGTVTAVNGSLGEKTTSKTLITLADLKNPTLTVNLDESDFIDIGMGCSVDVTFEAVSNQVFHGTLTQIEPTLATERNVEYIRGQVRLKSDEFSGKTLRLGLNASVELTCKEAKGVLIVSSEALKGISGNSAYLYVLNDAGQPEKRTVEIGLRTTAFTEIRSGVALGEKVITSGANLK